MATRSSHNKNNSAVKRILQEARELANDPSTDYTAAPLEEDIFEWHCTIRGSPGTEFEGGLYHCRILLPAEYPFRPPSIMLLTPNGRFELNTKICISFTSYHEELWQPAWGIRTAIIGLQGFFPLKGEAAVGVAAIDYPQSERRRLAALSRNWTCPHCKQSNVEILPDPTTTSAEEAQASSEESKPDTPAPAAVLEQPALLAAQFEPVVAAAPAPDLQPIIVQPVIAQPAQVARSKPRAPLALDMTIGAILIVVFALLCRKVGIAV